MGHFLNFICKLTHFFFLVQIPSQSDRPNKVEIASGDVGIGHLCIEDCLHTRGFLHI
jgi:hypothetical protein